MTGGRSRVSCAGLLLVLLVLTAASGREVRRDPVTGRIRILYMGTSSAGLAPTPFS